MNIQFLRDQFYVELLRQIFCSQVWHGWKMGRYLLPRGGTAAAFNAVVGRENVAAIWDTHNVMVLGCATYWGWACCNWNKESDWAKYWIIISYDKPNKLINQIIFISRQGGVGWLRE